MVKLEKVFKDSQSGKFYLVLLVQDVLVFFYWELGGWTGLWK